MERNTSVETSVVIVIWPLNIETKFDLISLKYYPTQHNSKLEFPSGITELTQPHKHQSYLVINFSTIWGIIFDTQLSLRLIVVQITVDSSTGSVNLFGQILRSLTSSQKHSIHNFHTTCTKVHVHFTYIIKIILISFIKQWALYYLPSKACQIQKVFIDLFGM